MRIRYVVLCLLLAGCTGTEAQPSGRDPSSLARTYFDALSRGDFTTVTGCYVSSLDSDDRRRGKIKFEIEQAKRKHYFAVKGASVQKIRVIKLPTYRHSFSRNMTGTVVFFQREGVLYYLPIKMVLLDDGDYAIVDVDAAHLAREEMMDE